MRRDVCYYFETDSASLYTAYLNAAKAEPFNRSCDERPYHTFSFGLNFSAKYNMNGGACTLHFIPLKTGAAVNLRFSIVQLGGARYEKYAAYLTEHVVKAINIPAQPCNINIDEFLKAENLVFTTVAPVQPAVSPAVSAPAKKLCSFCHNEVAADSVFCSHCGQKLVRPQVFCTQCGTKAQAGDRFCHQCGNKL